MRFLGARASSRPSEEETAGNGNGIFRAIAGIVGHGKPRKKHHGETGRLIKEFADVSSFLTVPTYVVLIVKDRSSACVIGAKRLPRVSRTVAPRIYAFEIFYSSFLFVKHPLSSKIFISLDVLRNT